jgi:hypothetical protein
MKQLILKCTIFFSLTLFTACSTSQQISPSQNDALNRVSNSNAATENGLLQSLLDNFLQDKWTPSVSKDKDIQKKYMKEIEIKEKNGTVHKKYVEKEDRPFRLQEYVDKRAAYIKAHPSDYNNSNVHKLEMMPVIGSSKKRR